jgi:RNA polymerase primary sigma factor
MDRAKGFSDEWLIKNLGAGRKWRGRKRRTIASLRLNATVRQQLVRLQQAEERLAHRLRRFPTLEQLCEETCLGLAQVGWLLKARRGTVSLSHRSREMPLKLVGELRDGNPEEAVEQLFQRDAVRRVLATLRWRERVVLQYRYGLTDGYPYSLEEVARLFRTNQERVRGIEGTALRRLSHPRRRRMLQGESKRRPLMA